MSHLFNADETPSIVNKDFSGIELRDTSNVTAPFGSWNVSKVCYMKKNAC